MGQLIREWDKSFEQCIRESRIDSASRTLPWKNPIPYEHITTPEDAMQIGLVPQFSLFGGYEKIVKRVDVFSRYLFS